MALFAQAFSPCTTLAFLFLSVINTLGGQKSTRFFGANRTTSGVIFVAGQ